MLALCSCSLTGLKAVQRCPRSPNPAIIPTDEPFSGMTRKLPRQGCSRTCSSDRSLGRTLIKHSRQSPCSLHVILYYRTPKAFVIFDTTLERKVGRHPSWAGTLELTQCPVCPVAALLAGDPNRNGGWGGGVLGVGNIDSRHPFPLKLVEG